MGARDWLHLILLAIVWGGSFFFVEVALEALPPFSLVMVRVGLAAGILHLYLCLNGTPLPYDPVIWLALLGMGFLNNAVPFALITWGQTEITSSLAAILNATTPLFTIIVAHFWTADERLTRTRIFGVVAGLAGVMIMTGADALNGIGGALVAQFAVLAAAISYAFAGVFGRRFKQMNLSPAQTAAGQLTAATLLLLPVAAVWDQPWDLPMPEPAVWVSAALALLGLAALSTALAYVIYFRVLATAGPTNLLLVTFLAPISAALLGITILGEQLTGDQISGMLMIGIGLAAIDGRPVSAFAALMRRT